MDINSMQFAEYNPYSILEDAELTNRFRVRLQDTKHTSSIDKADHISEQAVHKIFKYIDADVMIPATKLLAYTYTSIARIHEENLLRCMIRYSVNNPYRIIDSATFVMIMSGVSAYSVARARANLNSGVSFTKAVLKGVFTWNTDNFFSSMLKDSLNDEAYIPLRVTQTTMSLLLNVFQFVPQTDFGQIASLLKQYTYPSESNCTLPGCGELAVGRFADFLDSTVAIQAELIGGKTVRSVYEQYGEYESYCRRVYGCADDLLDHFFDRLHKFSGDITNEKLFSD